MRKPRKSAALGAAECARRTGLTVRALRVYERHGLIEPKRTAKGWRCYGREELRRLNVIVTLKSFGMTLAQIRTLLATQPPPLARVLRLQLQACRARKDAADKALGLVQTALASIESGGTLSLEELCDLTRSMEMGNQHAITRELINERITPEEERAVLTWMTTRSADEMKAMQEYGVAVRTLFRSLQDLREKQIDPAAPEAQALIVKWNELALRCGLRNFMAMLLEWNPAVAQKWLDVGERALSRSMSSAGAAPDEGLWGYFGAAQAASAWSQELTQITEQAARLVARKASPSSAPAKALAARLARICAHHALGEPVVYARWARAMQFRRSADVNAKQQAAWAFLTDALQAA